MPIIKVKAIHHVRLSAPDLDRMEQFLTDFGMRRAARTDSALYMRGMGPGHYIHVTELGPPGFLGFAYEARNPEDLETLSKATGSPVEAIDEPGGGSMVVLTDPNGFRIRVIHGVAQAEPIADTLSLIRKAGEPSTRRSPARVTRIAHGVLATPKLEESLNWYREMFGFIPTDELYLDDDRMMGSFNRVDAGPELVDHHVFFCVGNPAAAGMHHASFEVADPNDVFVGHDHLTRTGYEHIRGPSRHALGSQIFDYWVSPYDQMHELWSSNERFNADSGFNRGRIGQGMAHDTGPAPSQRFVKQATPAPARS